MNGTKLTLAIAGALVLAFLFGWIARWVFGRLNRIEETPPEDVSEMATRLHAMEETRVKAEADLASREADMKKRLLQAEAEITATMEALRAVRAENDQLRERLEASSGFQL